MLHSSFRGGFIPTVIKENQSSNNGRFWKWAKCFTSSTRIICLLIHLGILQKFQETKKLNSLGKNCEVQSKWNLYLQRTGLTLIVSKTGTRCQVSKEIGREKKLRHSPWFCKHVFKSSPKKKKKIALSFSWKQKCLCETFNVEAHNVLIKK